MGPNLTLQQSIEQHHPSFHNNEIEWGNLAPPMASEMTFHPSPTDQDMLDFLTQTVPDIWSMETLPQYTTQSSIMPSSSDIGMLPNSIEDSRALNIENVQNQLPSPNLTDVEASQAQDNHQRTSLDIPCDVVDEL